MPASPVFDSAARRRCVAVLAAGALLPPVLAGCSTDEDPSEGRSGAARDIAAYESERVPYGGVLRWAVDQRPRTLNAFQAEAGGTTDRIAEAVLPTLFPLDSRGRPELNEDYLESAEVTSREPQQTVVYTLNDRARWSDGKALSAEDFKAQWKALSGNESAFWSARNAGYDRVHKVEEGDGPRQVKVTFARPYSDWKSLFSPLYPRSVMGDSKVFNDDSRTELPVVAGPFRIKGGKVDRKDKTVTLERNPRWWGKRARLDSIVLTPVEREKRVKALARGELDLAEIDQSDVAALKPAADSAKPPAQARNEASSSASSSASSTSSPDAEGGDGDGGGDGESGASTSPSRSEKSEKSDASSKEPKESESAEADTEKDSKDDEGDEDDKDDKDEKDDEDKKDDEQDKDAKEKAEKARKKAEKKAEKEAAARRQAAAERRNLSQLTVRRALGPDYTQLAMNGSTGPLKDERVRRAIGRALDREKLAQAVLRPASLPGEALGSHLRTVDQYGYEDASDALGEGGTQAAAAQLADAGWRGGPSLGTHDAGADPGGDGEQDAKAGPAARPVLSNQLTHSSATAHAGLLRQAAHADQRLATAAKKKGGEEYERLREAAKKSMKEAKAADRALSRFVGGLLAAEGGLVRAKEGRKLELRMVLPAGPEAGELRATGKRIAYMLEEIGVHAEITEVPDDSYFEDHITNGDFDLALYSWPVSAYPVTDARPLFAKPVPAPDGSLLIEQNYTRVGTDQIDSLFEQAVTELDDEARADVLKRIDARVWAAAGSIPLYQRPELVAVNRKLANVGAFGLQTPRYQDIGYRE